MPLPRSRQTDRRLCSNEKSDGWQSRMRLKDAGHAAMKQLRHGSIW
jgi:hypothetical protein